MSGHVGGFPDGNSVNWSYVDNIKAEWPQSSLDATTDLRNYQNALALYDRDDYPTMMQCAKLFAAALAHSLYGPGILRGDELPNTVHMALYCSLCAPPDKRTFAEDAQRAARLAMTLMRENGWHPPSLGGSDPHFEGIMMDRGNYMLLTAAIAPPSQPWAGDLKAFFAMSPQLPAAVLAYPETPHLEDPVNRLEPFRAGPVASAPSTALGNSLYEDGRTLLAQGQQEQAMERFVEAAQAGSIDALAAAGDLCRSLGLQDHANTFYERAATAGHPIAMFNTAIAVLERGDRSVALEWLERSAGAGNIEAYAALTQLADESQDAAAEAHWAQLGAQAGHVFCLGRHGLLLARSANGDVATLQGARDALERAAAQGDVDSAGMAVSVNQQLGDPARAQHFVSIVVQSGNQEAIDRLRRFGFLG